MAEAGGITAEEAIETFDLDERTLRRYLSDFRGIDVPVRDDGRGADRTLSLDPSWGKEGVQLSLLEWVSLHFGRSLFDFLKGTGFAEDMDDALERISAWSEARLGKRPDSSSTWTGSTSQSRSMRRITRAMPTSSTTSSRRCFGRIPSKPSMRAWAGLCAPTGSSLTPSLTGGRVSYCSLWMWMRVTSRPSQSIDSEHSLGTAKRPLPTPMTSIRARSWRTASASSGVAWKMSAWSSRGLSRRTFASASGTTASASSLSERVPSR